MRLARREMFWSVALLAAAVGVAAAQDRPAKRGWEGGRRGPAMAQKRLAEFLGLSEDQRASWEAAHKDFESAVQPLAKQMRGLHQEMEKAVEAPKADPTAVGKLVLAIRDLRVQMKAAHKKLDDQLDAILTPEQRTKLEAFKAARKMERPRHGHDGPMGFGGRGGPEGPPPFPPEPDDDGN